MQAGSLIQRRFNGSSCAGVPRLPRDAAHVEERNHAQLILIERANLPDNFQMTKAWVCETLGLSLRKATAALQYLSKKGFLKQLPVTRGGRLYGQAFYVDFSAGTSKTGEPPSSIPHWSTANLSEARRKMRLKFARR